MSEAVIVGLISVVGSVIVQLIVSFTKSQEANAKMAVHEQKQQDALEAVKDELAGVKKRLDAHNGYAEKFANATKDIAIVQKDIENIREQMKNLQLCKTK